jgi:hypothetical protein
VITSVGGLAPFDQLLEAEAATISGVLIRANYAGYTGTGFGDYYHTSGDYLQWSINAPAAGNYSLQIRYALPTGNRPLSVKINDNPGFDVSFPATGAWDVWVTSTVSVTLVSGSNTISLTSIGYNGPNVDHIKVSGSSGSLATVTEKYTPEYVRYAEEEDEAINEYIMIYPVPATGSVTIKSHAESKFISLVQADGRIHHPQVERVDDNTIHVDVSSMPSGISVLVLNVNGKMIWKKFLVE